MPEGPIDVYYVLCVLAFYCSKHGKAVFKLKTTYFSLYCLRKNVP